MHSQTERRYKCHECGKTFAATRGTAFYRLHHPVELMVLVVSLLVHGCPTQAIVAAFGLDERTVARWQREAAQQSERVHRHVVEVPRDLGQVQADELRVRLQGGVVWLALALQVSTRLWLGGVVSRQRDSDLIAQLLQQVRRCALCRPLLLAVDGLAAYLSQARAVFRSPLRDGQRGRPQLRAWDGLCVTQVIKHSSARHVTEIVRRVAHGTVAQVDALLAHSQPTRTINTAYIERLNATFRARLAPLARRTRAVAQRATTLHNAMYLLGTVYNFCTPHQALRLPLYLPRGRHWVARTPAMAAGLTDHCWSLHELLSFPVPPPPWRPPKRRGRLSQATKDLLRKYDLATV